MKKISYRDRLLIVFACLALIVFAFYKYVYEPFEKKAKDLTQKRDELKIEASSKNVETISGRISSLKKELETKNAEKKEFENKRMITKEQQEQLLLFIGEKAKELDINLNKFEEEQTESTSSYNVVGYDIKAQGESKNLILFLNSLYKFYNYCFITDLNLRKVEVEPTFDADKFDSLSDEEKTIMDWDEDKVKLILMDIPPLVEKKSTDSTTDSTTETQQKEEESTPSVKALQLDFSLYFILSE
ncbi:hypothetical protein U8V72_19815 [Priestia filamentosa]|uniref:hypothetical protein n=1 Tax=Priestia filamentosa TaxID=1402861 RepID=UPI0005890D96